METLLSLSFDALSSPSGPKIRKGLRQLDSLLAQICLSAPPTHQKAPPPTGPKPLSTLKEDPAFREFYKLQEGFEWNVASRLVACLERLLGKVSNAQNNLLIVSTLDLLQGILLIHPASRSLFAREIYMNLLLDLLEPLSTPPVQSSTLLTLVTALLSHPRNTRTFESLDGLRTITSLFKSRATTREVKLKLVEFLYFYLMPETPEELTAAGKMGGDGLVVGGGVLEDGKAGTRSTEEKQGLLGRYLGDVGGLVEDLRESAPFGRGIG